MATVIELGPPVTATRHRAVAALRWIADQLAAMEPAQAVEALVQLQHELAALERRSGVVLRADGASECR